MYIRIDVTDNPKGFYL